MSDIEPNPAHDYCEDLFHLRTWLRVFVLLGILDKAIEVLDDLFLGLIDENNDIGFDHLQACKELHGLANLLLQMSLYIVDVYI